MVFESTAKSEANRTSRENDVGEGAEERGSRLVNCCLLWSSVNS